jgi:guanosine-3',5'-bis(diphosphate) 3'-pyrophosphohydrolase
MSLKNFPSQEELEWSAWGATAKSPIPIEEQEVARGTVATLKEWQASSDTLEAALLIPFLGRGHNRVPKKFTPAAFDLAQRVVRTREVLTELPGTEVEREGARHSGILSKLYRQIYLDLPSLPFTLLLLADHDTRVSSTGQLSEEAAKLSRQIFAPIAEMLGLWHLVKRWEERSFEVLWSNEYLAMRKLLGERDDYTSQAFQNLFERGALAKKKGESTTDSYLIRKAEAFLSIRQRLMGILIGRDVIARITPIRNYLSFALRRVHQGEAKEDVAQRLCIRVVCRTVEDCYTALGAFHSLGKPVSLSSHLYFRDQIASPQANGYRAIHAAITYRGFRGDGSGQLVVECRIMTREMLKLNEYGAVAALLRKPGVESPPNVWWNQHTELNSQLSRMGYEAGIIEYLKNHDTATDSEPLYTFTPLGEIVLLSKGATALDFAYQIHTEMGHHAIKIEVNRQIVTHGYRLRNGDVVRVYHDPDFAGPDISWMGIISTSSARREIQQKLKARAAVTHQGRAFFEEALLRILDRIRRKKKYDLYVTNERAERFLVEYAEEDGCANVSELYDKLTADPTLAWTLVLRLISSELGSIVKPSEAAHTSSNRYPVSVCTTCLPVPGEEIVGVAAAQRRGRVLAHRSGYVKCLGRTPESRQLPLFWADVPRADQNELYSFWIKGNDREGILQDVLNVARTADGTYLYKVQAQVHGDGRADISLLVKANTTSDFPLIQSQLVKVPGVSEVLSGPPSPSERASLLFPISPLRRPRRQEPYSNPYTPAEVYHRGIFFGREELLGELIEWLEAKPPTQVMILHGQRRVGKSSLVRYFIEERVRPYRLALPVFVDLQGLTKFGTPNVVNFLARKVYNAIGQVLPRRAQREEPLDWLNRVLDEARRQTARLLIAIDEFNVLSDVERAGGDVSVVYRNLRSVMHAQREINWLLVAQDTHFYNSEMSLGAGALFQTAQALAVKHLNTDWARRLILEPARERGLVPQDEGSLIQEVMRLTAGSPYLIHLICHQMMKRAKSQGRSNLTNADVRDSASSIIYDGDRHFFHFTELLTGERELVMAAVVATLDSTDSADEEAILQVLRQPPCCVSEKAVRHILTNLATAGLLSFRNTDGGRRFTIPIELFRMFITNKLDVDASRRKLLTFKRPLRKEISR